MYLFIYGNPKRLRRSESPWLGHLVHPKQRNKLDGIFAYNRPWAADNGAFSDFCPDSFIRMLGELREFKRRDGLWIACPDVVGDAAATRKRYTEWAPQIKEYGHRVAYVSQDGVLKTEVPWDDFSCLFLGGTNDFKLGDEGREITRQAKSRGKWVHMGRVNSRKRARYAASIGCNSIDGSSYHMFPEVHIPKAEAYLQEINDERKEKRRTVSRGSDQRPRR